MALAFVVALVFLILFKLPQSFQLSREIINGRRQQSGGAIRVDDITFFYAWSWIMR
eukprot:jgi/Phyca11/510984/fgenesh2_kg.PHYCAscaffold_72_\